jgi:predicted transcriptional regulator
MKSVLISIQPKWCELIASGKKTVEVRKKRPKVDEPFKCYIYQTLHREHNGRTYSDGKVIGEFVCNEIYLLMQTMSGIAVADMDWCVIDPDWFRDASCLTDEEVCNYLNDNDGFAWLISDLVIYDEPKNLSDFKIVGCKGCRDKDTYHCKFHCTGERKIKRPPQSWCYVEKG